MSLPRFTADRPTRAGFLTSAFLALGERATDPADLYFGLHLRLHGPPPDLLALRALVAERAARVPLLTHRLTVRPDGPWWEPDPLFDAAHHVHQLPDGDLAPRSAQSLLSTPPDDNRPRWGLWLQRGDARDWALCYLVHHAVQDATSMLHTLRALFEHVPHAPFPTGPAPANSTPRGTRTVRSLMPLLPGVLGTYLPRKRWNQPRQNDGALPVLAHSAVGLTVLRASARATGTTVNDVHLAAMATAVGDWNPDPHPAGPWWRRGPHVLVPVSTRLPEDREDLAPDRGNRIGLLRTRIPCTASDRRRLSRRRVALRALTEHTPPRLAAWILGRVTDPSGVALTASHIRVDEPLTVLGSRVTDTTAIPWLPPGHGCFTFLVTYDGTARLSALTRTANPNPRRLTGLWSLALRSAAPSRRTDDGDRHLSVE
ncbi:wax ester/triacylglycerol synthase domain-containing protein [Streptomyces sp. NPDC091280]|uniref:wax ester/triacylglycerol synthase domain-containing protein n=1 Tax=Streptomyces sp. NPDC091280 TaxID=3365984 RepID=UPI003800D45A